jgi:hypothetical protein
MYQSLIWALVASDDAGGLCAPFNTQDCERLADPLVHGVGRNLEFGSDFLGGKELVDEPQAIKLAGRQSRDARRHLVGRIRA